MAYAPDIPRPLRVTIAAPYVPDRGHRHAGGAFLTRYVDGLVERGEEVTLVAPVAAETAVATEREHHVTVRRLHLPSSAVRVASFPLDVSRAPTLGFTVVRSAREPGVRSAFENADVIELQWTETLALIPSLRVPGPAPPILAFEYDVLFDAVRRRARFGRSAPRRAVDRLRGLGLQRREVKLLNQTQHVRVFSDADAEVLQSAGVRVPVSVAAPSIDLPAVAGGPVADPNVLFVGWFGRPENEDAARWMLAGPWPVIRSRHPGARLILAGADPSPGLQHLAHVGRGVEVTGEVVDLGAVYRRARVAVVPNRAGGGLKFKIAEAMAHGLPVVATPESARGYLEHGAPLVVAAGIDAFAEEVGRLLEAGPTAARIGAEGRRWVESHYDFESFLTGTVDLHHQLRAKSR